MHVNESIDRRADRCCIYNTGEGWINAYLMCKEARMLGQGCRTRAGGGRRWGRAFRARRVGGSLNNQRLHFLFTQHQHLCIWNALVQQVMRPSHHGLLLWWAVTQMSIWRSMLVPSKEQLTLNVKLYSSILRCLKKHSEFTLPKLWQFLFPATDSHNQLF